MKKILLKKRIRATMKAAQRQKLSTIKTKISRKPKKQRQPLQKRVSKDKDTKKALQAEEFVKTGIAGFDALLDQGIPKGVSVLVAGGTGTGKTIFCLQTLFNAAKRGEKCLYLSFEESEQRLKKHLDDFKWDWRNLEKKGLLKIIRKEPFSMITSIEAMLAKAKGELLIDINEVLEIIPPGFQPKIIAVDSVTAIASAFGKKEEGYRIFIEQLFRYFETLTITSFFISETEQMPTIYSSSGIEEFLADGVIVFYAIRQGNIRENALEVLKLRGTKHQKKIVAMQITNKGLEIYPEQEVFGDLGK